MLEKREWKRITLVKVAKCRPIDESRYHHVQIVDIHHQGCCLKTDVGFKKLQEVRIVVELPLEGSLYLAGEVAWIEHDRKDRSFRIGVRFISSGPQADEAHAKLYNFCMTQ